MIPYIVAAIVLQLGGTPAEADAVWEDIAYQPRSHTPSEFVTTITESLDRIRRTSTT